MWNFLYSDFPRKRLPGKSRHPGAAVREAFIPRPDKASYPVPELPQKNNRNGG